MYYPPRFLFRRYELVRRLPPGSRFLEVGPGSMNLTRDLLRRYGTGVVVDFNQEVLEFHRHLPEPLRDRIRVIISDLSSADVQGAFDCVVACEVLEHVEDDLAFLRTVHGLLAKGGGAVMSVPARMKFWSVHDETVGHIRRYEKAELEELFREAGFREIRTVSYGYPFINMLRALRIGLARLQSKKLSGLSEKEKTRRSGTSQYKLMSGLLGIFVNRYTVSPFALFASLFNRLDRSDGYILTALR